MDLSFTWLFLTTIFTAGSVVITKNIEKYTPDWNSLDKRPLPSWYDSDKIGIFIHWGVYSVPSFTSEWFWIDWKGNPSPNKAAQVLIEKYMKANYKPGFSYQDFAHDFTAEFFNPKQWVDLIERSGAKYVILTSKHHDGYALWPSNYSFSWNSVDVGPHRDIVGELAEAVRSSSLRFGLYHSLYEWFNPLYLSDKANNYTTREFVDKKIMPEMKELVNKYKPEVFWSDGEWEAESSYWQSEQFLSWLYNDSPVSRTVVANDRWGTGTLCNHGGFLTCQDRYNPGVVQPRKWENAMTIGDSWGYNRRANIEQYKTTKELIEILAQTISCGGNLVMNIGPRKDGTIDPIFQDRLLGVGKWLKLNGEAIYKSKPWDNCQNDTYTSGVWYTTSPEGKTLYVLMLKWPKLGVLYLACPRISKNSSISMIGYGKPLQATTTDKQMIKIDLPDKASVPGEWAWVLRITHIQSL